MSQLVSQGSPAVHIESLATVTDEALSILNEYYDAVSVVRRDTVEGIQQLLVAPGSGMWLARLEGRVVGCVVLRKLEQMPFAGECKRLYVTPNARGKRIADMLLDALEDYARSQELRWIYLDSYDDLKAAIALYARRGYRDCEPYNDNPQATVFMRKDLTSV